MPMQDILRGLLRAHFQISDECFVPRSGFRAVLELYLAALGMPRAHWPTPKQVHAWMIVQFPVSRRHGAEVYQGLGLIVPSAKVRHG